MRIDQFPNLEIKKKEEKDSGCYNRPIISGRAFKILKGLRIINEKEGLALILFQVGEAHSSGGFLVQKVVYYFELRVSFVEGSDHKNDFRCKLSFFQTFLFLFFGSSKMIN